MSSSEPTSDLTRWRLDLAYDGAAFRGFAEQPDLATVVGTLRVAIARALRLPVQPEIVGAGRTDAGVHALAQVVHVDLPAGTEVDAEHLVRRLNRQLKGSILVLSARETDADFHARFSATWRRYRYLVLEGEDPLSSVGAIAWGVSGPLDGAMLNDAAQRILGEHDFRAFCRRPSDKSKEDPLVRRVNSASWIEVADELTLSPVGRFWRFEIEANAFCHQMVRSLVGAMVAVGQGRLAANELDVRLRSGDRQGLPAPAPAAGLSLIGVGYGQLAGGPSGPVT